MRHSTKEFRARWLNYGQPKKKYEQPTAEQVRQGKYRRKLEKMLDDIWLNHAVKEEWDL